MKLFRYKKLSTAFLLPIILTVFIVLTLWTVIDAISERTSLTETLEKQAAGMLGVAGASAANAFWNYNDVALKEIGDTLSTNPTVAVVRLIDEGGNLVYENRKTSIAYDSNYLYPEFKREIYKSDMVIGEIQMTLTSYYLDKEIKVNIVQSFVRTIIISCIMMLIILLLSRNISSSIDKIARGVKEFADGETKARIQIKTDNEIKSLADRINNMFDAIIDSRVLLAENYQVLKKQEEALRVAEERYRYAVEGSNDAIWDWNLLSKEYYVSKRGIQMIGLSDDGSVDLKVWMSFIHNQDRVHFQEFLDSFHDKQTNYGQIEFRVIDSIGQIRWLFCRGKGIVDQDNKLIRVSGFFTDITERIKAEEAINKLAYYDVLTGLPNRSMLFERFHKILEDHPSQTSCGAMFYVDLDNFKTINDTKGHSIGDSVLVCLAEEFVKTIDCDLIARIGGDEFIFVQKECNPMEASKLANVILSVVNQPWSIGGFEFNISCSIGITIFPNDGTDINKLLMNADSAMYEAKEQGKDQFKFFEHSINEAMVRKIELQNEIRQGIVNKEFVLYYQPQLDLASGRIKGVEALVRWQHPQNGLLPPGAFITVAEESGLIIQLGEFILRTACEQSVKWEQAGIHDISMAVNFSAKQINKKNILQDIYRILNETGMRHDLLDIEITESIAMENLDNTIAIMKQLKEKNIRFSLDDFGTGYSSLNYLNNLPIDHVKIDKQFVQNVSRGSFEEVVIKAIIDIAHNMNLVVIAEGVETQEQLEAIKEFNGDLAQGYYVSRPIPSKEMEEMLTSV